MRATSTYYASFSDSLSPATLLSIVDVPRILGSHSPLRYRSILVDLFLSRHHPVSLFSRQITRVALYAQSHLHRSEMVVLRASEDLFVGREAGDLGRCE